MLQLCSLVCSCQIVNPYFLKFWICPCCCCCCWWRMISTEREREEMEWQRATRRLESEKKDGLSRRAASKHLSVEVTRGNKATWTYDSNISLRVPKQFILGLTEGVLARYWPTVVGRTATCTASFRKPISPYYITVNRSAIHCDFDNLYSPSYSGRGKQAAHGLRRSAAFSGVSQEKGGIRRIIFRGKMCQGSVRGIGRVHVRIPTQDYKSFLSLY